VQPQRLQCTVELIRPQARLELEHPTFRQAA